MAGSWFELGFSEQPLGPGARVLFLDCPPLYDRAGIYNEQGIDYADNALRFGLLSAAVRRLARPSTPADAHRPRARLAGGAGAGLPPRPRVTRRPCSPSTTSRIRASSTRRGCRGWGWAGRTSPCSGFEFFDRLSLLKAGINFADHVTTVSPTYADEIQRPEYGNGFDGVMRARRAR